MLIFPDNGNRQQHAPNGIYYPIDHVMTYDSDVPDKVLNTRLRYNPIMNLPELMTLQSLSRLNLFYPVPDQLTANIRVPENMIVYDLDERSANTVEKSAEILVKILSTTPILAFSHGTKHPA